MLLTRVATVTQRIASKETGQGAGKVIWRPAGPLKLMTRAEGDGMLALRVCIFKVLCHGNDRKSEEKEGLWVDMEELKKLSSFPESCLPQGHTSLYFLSPLLLWLRS